MVKDRLGALKAALSEACDSDNTANNTNEEETLLSGFFSLVEELSSYLDKIDTTIDDIKKKHCMILSSSYTDERIRHELESLMAEVKRLSNKVKQKLKTMSEEIQLEEQSKISLKDLRIKKIQHSALSRRFIAIMSDYNTVQTDYRQKCKDRIKRQLEIMGETKSDAEIEALLECGNIAVFTQDIIVETQKARQNLEDIENRYADIIQLEKSIRELHDIFVDMAVLTDNQSDIVDSIEYNVKKAAVKVYSGKIDLGKGLISQRKARKKIVILSILATIVTIIILGIIIGVIVKK